ncbi:glycosyltransferase [Alteromonas sp. 07-89-2]|uniref:CgeB family protein n=1 Tax=Alteromonas sp. 07-89-2 TaxID=2607609 RepID=UPI00148C7451|nr:glycosyltransferase [Alteromonas sp. 07-89-2]NOH57422.1 glycosyltransferase [Alteromonas sp. 07-89-2]
MIIETMPTLHSIRVAAILDGFSSICIEKDTNLFPISPSNWKEEVKQAQPDFLFVESCWFGNNNQWGSLIYGNSYNAPNRMDELTKVVEYCRKKGIPTVFWSKEDPVHYDKFAPTAKLFDFVFTTDANMVESYKKDFGIDAEPLCFFCQPVIHNPSEVIPRKNKAAFAGSYYSTKKERCADFDVLIDALKTANVEYDIFDRCLYRKESNLKFPERFKQNVVGHLKPDEMWKAYKGYKYTINMNSVKQSPTMFARRVYESLASGTPVVSNYSKGVVEQFGDIVCASDDPDEIVSFLEKMQDESEYRKVVEKGVREVLSKHTVADRLEQICSRIGIAITDHLPNVHLVANVSNINEAEHAYTVFTNQTYRNKRLVVNMVNESALYPYLLKTNSNTTFRLVNEFTQPPKGLRVELTMDKDLPTTALEDAALKTLYSTNV